MTSPETKWYKWTVTKKIVSFLNGFIPFRSIMVSVGPLNVLRLQSWPEWRNPVCSIQTVRNHKLRLHLKVASVWVITRETTYAGLSMVEVIKPSLEYGIFSDRLVEIISLVHMNLWQLLHHKVERFTMDTNRIKGGDANAILEWICSLCLVTWSGMPSIFNEASVLLNLLSHLKTSITTVTRFILQRQVTSRLTNMMK